MGNQIIQKPRRRREVVKKSDFVYSIIKGNIVRDTLMTSQAKSCRGLQFAKLENKNYLRDFGVCEKAHERDAIAKYQATPVDTKWIDTQRNVRGTTHPNQVTTRGTRVQKAETVQNRMPGLSRWKR